jgi:uncharacterized protein (TIGR02117 family)
MKKAMRWLAAAITVMVLLPAAGTFVPRPLFVTRQAPQVGATHRVLVLSNPIHTDIAIPLTTETRAAYAFLGASGSPVADPGAEWLIVGWGGRAFYLETPTWADLRPLPVFRALTIGSSVMHVDVAGAIDESHPAITALDLSDDEFQRLSAFIQASFVREGDDVVAIEGAGYGAYDRFYEAHGSFNALLGCNTWTAAALRAGGLRTGLWNPMPQTLTLSLKMFN